MKKRIVICADDFAQSLPISEGILKLLKLRRIHAVSCMTNSPYWPEMAKKLERVPGEHQVGLHVNLTHSFEGEHGRVSQLLLKSGIGSINLTDVRNAFIKQWNLFEEHYARPPAFVDGHQHVHAFPHIRDVIFKETALRNPDTWVRYPLSYEFSAKELLIRCLTKGFPAEARLAGLRFNSSFGGFRSFRRGFDFSEFFGSLLAKAPDGTLIMCHPGNEAVDPCDPIAAFREEELRYLSSEKLISDLQDANAVLMGPMY